MNLAALEAREAQARLPIALHFPRPAGHEGDWFPQPMVKVTLPCFDGRHGLELPALIDTGAALSAWPLSYARLLLGPAADELKSDEPMVPATGVEHPAVRYPGGLDVEVGGYRVRLAARFIDTKLNHAILGLNDFLAAFDMVVRWQDHELRLYPRPSVDLAEPQRAEAEAPQREAA